MSQRHFNWALFKTQVLKTKIAYNAQLSNMSICKEM